MATYGEFLMAAVTKPHGSCAAWWIPLHRDYIPLLSLTDGRGMLESHQIAAGSLLHTPLKSEEPDIPTSGLSRNR